MSTISVSAVRSFREFCLLVLTGDLEVYRFDNRLAKLLLKSSHLMIDSTGLLNSSSSPGTAPGLSINIVFCKTQSKSLYTGEVHWSTIVISWSSNDGWAHTERATVTDCGVCKTDSALTHLFRSVLTDLTTDTTSFSLSISILLTILLWPTYIL